MRDRSLHAAALALITAFLLLPEAAVVHAALSQEEQSAIACRYESAVDLRMAEQFDEALAAFSNYVSAVENCGDAEFAATQDWHLWCAWLWRARLHMRAGRMAPAAACADRALEVLDRRWPEPSPWYARREKVHVLLNRYETGMSLGRVGRAFMDLTLAEALLTNGAPPQLLLAVTGPGPGAGSAEPMEMRNLETCQSLLGTRYNWELIWGSPEGAGAALTQLVAVARSQCPVPPTNCPPAVSARETPETARFRALGVALSDLAAQAASREDYEAAISNRETILRMPYSRQYAFERDLCSAHMAAELFMRHGPTNRVFDLLDAAISNLTATAHLENLADVVLTKARIAADAGRTAAAIALLDELIEKPAAGRRDTHAAAALRLKAQLCIEDGDPAAAAGHLERCLALYRSLSGDGTDFQPQVASVLEDLARAETARGRLDPAQAALTNAIGICRAIGLKRAEPDLYELGAVILVERGDCAAALRVLEDMFRMSETLKMPDRALAALLAIADVHFRRGQAADLSLAWKRIDAFAEHAGRLPARMTLRLLVGRLQLLEATGGTAALARQRECAAVFAAQHRLPTRDQTDLRRWAPGRWTPVAVAATATAAETTAAGTNAVQTDTGRPGTSTVHQVVHTGSACPSADLQPQRIVSRVGIREPARGRFVLANPAAAEARGVMALSGPALAFEWRQAGDDWHVLVSATNPAAAGASEREMSVPPSRYRAVTIEAVPTPDGATGRVNVAWMGAGGGRQQARWEFSCHEDRRVTAVVNASEAAESPFYWVDLYHEIYCRDERQVLTDVRVSGSVPCRVEIVDAATGAIVAVDGNADGDFEDAGDVLAVDANMNGFPDFAGSARTVAAFHLYVFPGAIPAGDVLDLTVWTGNGSQWHADAVDSLHTGGGAVRPEVN